MCIVTILVSIPIILLVVWIAVINLTIAGLVFFPISGVFLWITIINYIGYLIFTSVLKGLDMLKANGKKIDFNNLNLDRSYTLEEFEFINDQLKTRILEIDGHPVNLFDLDKNGKLIPMPQSPYSREKVVAEIVRQLSNWNIWTRQNGGVTSSQGGFDFDVGGGKTIRAPDIAYAPKEIDCQLDAQQNWSLKVILSPLYLLSKSETFQVIQKILEKQDQDNTNILLESEKIKKLIDSEFQQVEYINNINEYKKKINELVSQNKELLSENKELLSENKALLSENKELLFENKALLSENKALLSENKELLFKNKELLSENKALLSENKELLSKNKELKDERFDDQKIRVEYVIEIAKKEQTRSG
ncbi:6152_t:CDS:2 [Entrophospora sp. SA101]|nr:6152_t:CDS:2 [Entrophospora sp. SA101]